MAHGYLDDSQESKCGDFNHKCHAYSRLAWIDGITPWIGVKGIVDELRVDMHQRDQETQVRGVDPDTTKTTHRKPFYAAEVVLKGVDLRTVLATFAEPLKAEVFTAKPPSTSNAYLKYDDLPQTSTTSSWYNINDFIELDWTSSSEPILHYIPLLTCPRFAYFKRNAAKTGSKQDNKFGTEDTHHCLLGQEPCKEKLIRSEKLGHSRDVFSCPSDSNRFGICAH